MPANQSLKLTAEAEARQKGGARRVNANSQRARK